MNAWKHSISSQINFGGVAKDYLEIHKFLDSSKNFFYHLKHRAMLHHLLGIEYCEDIFGSVIENSDSQMIPVREIAAQHIREDLNQTIPSLNDWFQDCGEELTGQLEIPEIRNQKLEEFVLAPWLRSGLKATLVITFSHFGVDLARRLHGWEMAKSLAEIIPARNNPKRLLEYLPIKHRWQYSPDREAINKVNNETSKNRQN